MKRIIRLLSLMMLLPLSASSEPDTLWTKTFGGPEGDMGRCVRQTNDGGYIITGYTSSYSASGYDIWLIRLEDDLSPVVNSPGQKIPDEFILYPPYPNPFNSTTKVSFTLPEARLVSLNVYNMQGHLVLKLVDGWRNVGVHEITWDAAEIASGIYIYRLEAGNFIASGKMVLIK